MNKSKLTVVLNRLSANQLKRFERFLSISEDNNKENIAFFKLLRKYMPNYSGLTKKKVHKLLFPQKKYSDSSLWYLMSNLLILLERFIVYEAFNKDEFQKSAYLLNYYIEQGLSKHFKQNIQQIKKKLNKRDEEDTNLYYNRYLLADKSDQYFAKQEIRIHDESLQIKVEQLDIFYLSTMLKSCCQMLNRNNLYDAGYDLNMIYKTISDVKDKITHYRTFPIIDIYYHIYLTLTDQEDESHFRKLTQLLYNHSLKFSKQEIKDMYDYLQNYCVKKINKGNIDYVTELFNSYEFLLHNNLLMEGQYMNQWDYKNIVFLGLRLRKFKWTEQFIYQSKEKLAPAYQENAFTYNLAALYFFKKEFDEVLPLLQTIDFVDVSYSLESKLMLIKTYYELNEAEAMFASIDTFRIFLIRNKLISDYKRKLYFNLIKYIKKASNIRPGNKKKIDMLKKEILETKQVADIGWLMDKIDELK